ncbi:MAG TPA: MarC family protein [Flavipsychrobacter sp.]|nr:MarC family protein [Flavipsychrobacter sp.]
MFSLSSIRFQDIVTLTFTLFAVIDVLGSIPVIISLKKRVGEVSASQATMVSGALMLLFFFIGERMLNFMGIDIHSFAIAGSIVIFILGLEMVLGIEFFRSEKDMKSGAVVPIAFPMIAGSGTLTTLMSLKAEYNGFSILIAILINLVFVYITLISINRIERVLGPSGISVIRKFFGVILLAIAVKIFKSNVGF